MLKIAITGHRTLLNETAVRQEIALSFAYFKTQDSAIQALSALAVGADTIFAEEAQRAGIPLRVVLPFALADYQQDFAEPERAQLTALLASVGNQYEVVNTLNTHTAGERDGAYLATGKKLVDEADIVVAVWDGQPASGKGGTGDIVAYAQKQGKELHIVQSVRDNTVPKHPIHSVFDELDTQAIRYKKRYFVRAWWTGLTFAVLAVVCFALGLIFKDRFTDDGRFLVAVLEVFFLLISAILLLLTAKTWKNKFLRSRRDAEYLRAVIWCKEADVPVPSLQESKHKRKRYAISDNILELERNVAETLTAIRNFPNAKRKAWCLAEAQIRYHQHKRIDTFEGHEKTLETVLGVIKYIFFTAVVVKFAIELLEYLAHHHIENPVLHTIEGLLPYLNFSVIVLPPLFAALEGVKFFGEWNRNIAVSENSIEQLKDSKERVQGCTDAQSLMTEVAKLRHILELENSDWAIRYNQKEVEMVV